METINLVIIIILFFMVLVNAFILFWIKNTEKRLKKFFMGKKAENLENYIDLITKELGLLKEYKEFSEKEINNNKKRLDQNISHVKTLRFNPFGEKGGNQSFAISLLNDKGDGVVISSIYSRERTNIFAKPIIKMNSEYELTEEEIEVLNKK